MNLILKAIDHINATIGKLVSWSAVLLILIIVVDVCLRYVFSLTSAATFELEWHLFAAMFLLGAAWTFQEDKHVRVDLFYQKMSEKSKAWVNLSGTLFLLLPFCFVAISESITFVHNAYLLGETSPDPGGLPARYIIKSTIPIGLSLLALQGVAMILRSIQTIIK